MTERQELIARLREYASTNLAPALMAQAADMLEADAQPTYGWLTACDEEMICYHLGVANLSDSYESAKRKLRALIDLNVAIATDPAVNGGMSLQPAVPQEHDLHNAIMNIQATPDKTAGVNFQLAYKMGHRDARHAAAELALASSQQRPRLTDDEIVEWTDAVIRKEAFNRPIAIEIAKQAARWAEKKVRGEA